MATIVWGRGAAIDSPILSGSGLIAEAAVPKIGLTADEFRIYLHAVALEADRLELVFTERDAQ